MTPLTAHCSHCFDARRPTSHGHSRVFLWTAIMLLVFHVAVLDERVNELVARANVQEAQIRALEELHR